MNYVVLARRYRPQTFDEVIGQKHVVATLKNAILSNRIHHAYLFGGPRGVGKTSLARILAKSLNCAEGPTPTPCGKCASCLEITEAASVDVIEIDGASNRGIDAVRDLRETVRFLPQKGRFKVYIIDEVHMLTKEAFNALLKTLEEPPPYVKFIFATTESHKILPTILSRCQRFDFNRISPADTKEKVRQILEKEGIEMGERGVNIIIRAAQGGMRDALSLLDHVIAFGGKKIDDETVASALGMVSGELLDALTEAIIACDDALVLQKLAEGYNQGQDIRQLLDALTAQWRDIVILKTAGKSAEILTDLSTQEREKLLRLSSGRSPDVFIRQLNMLVDAAYAVSQASDPRLVIEITLLKMLRVADVTPIGELISALESGAAIAPSRSVGGGAASSVQASSAPRQAPEAARSMLQRPPSPASSAPAVADVSTEAQKKSEPAIVSEQEEAKPSAAIVSESPTGVPASSSASSEETARILEEVIGKLADKLQGPAVSSLRAARLLLEKGRARLLFEDNVTYYQAAREEVMNSFTSALGEVAGGGLKVEFEKAEPALWNRAPLSIKESERLKEKLLGEELRKQALEDPQVQEVMKIFQTEVAEVVRKK